MTSSAILIPSVVLRMKEVLLVDVGQSARSMSVDGIFTDLTFICAGGQRLSAHQTVVHRASPLLAEILQANHELPHCNTCSFSRPELTVSVPEVDAGCLSALLDLVYTGCTHAVDTAKKWTDLSSLIDLLGMRIVLERIQYDETESTKPSLSFSSPSSSINVQPSCTTSRIDALSASAEAGNEERSATVPNGDPTRTKKRLGRRSVSASRIERVRSSLKKRRAPLVARAEVCSECGWQAAGDGHALADHVALQHQNHRLEKFIVEENGARTCLFCSKALPGSKKALLHIARKHQPLAILQTENFGTFDNEVREFGKMVDSFRWDTVAHLGTQAKGHFPCPMCHHKTYESRARMQQHCANHFSAILMDYYKLRGVSSCPFCQKILAGKYSMYQHVGIFHKKILDFVKNKEFENYLFCRS